MAQIRKLTTFHFFVGCDLRTHFQCGNYTSCLENHRKCDKKVDCWDKSDEINCYIGKLNLKQF